VILRAIGWRRDTNIASYNMSAKPLCFGKRQPAWMLGIDKEVTAMPVISMFYGIIVRMYLLDNQHHNLPHIHARYAEFEASLSIDDGEILAGDLPRKQLRLVQAWIEIHRDELRADWQLAVAGDKPYKIAPL
jgi:hypothetical protein